MLSLYTDKTNHAWALDCASFGQTSFFSRHPLSAWGSLKERQKHKNQSSYGVRNKSFWKESEKHRKSTDIFGFENPQPKSRAEEPNREFYQAQVDKIWHGCSTLNTEWGYRSDFVISTWGLRYGLPRAPRGWVKKLKIFFLKKSKFLVSVANFILHSPLDNQINRFCMNF